MTTPHKNGMKSLVVTQQELKELFSYDRSNGVFTRISNHKNGIKAGSISGTPQKSRKPYLVIRINGRLYMCHRLAWLYVHGSFPQGVVDHINGDGFDNRIDNLRDVTNEQNIQCSLKIPKHNTSGFKGVCWRKVGGKWMAGISINNKRKHLGLFDTAEEASIAYLKAKQEVHFQ